MSSLEITTPSAPLISLQHSLQNYLCGQKRTGRQKCFTVLQGNKVYKGPFSENKLNRLKWRTQWFKYWKTPLILYPEEYLTIQDGQFVQYLNLVVNPAPETDWNQESFSDFKYRIIKRSDVVKLADVLQEDWIRPFDYQLLLALVQLWILQGGDVGIHNILARKSTQEVFLIDWEETRTKEIGGPEFYFTKPAGKKHQWLDKVGLHYTKVSQDLQTMLLDSQNLSFKDRIEQAIELLKQHTPAGTSRMDLGQLFIQGMMPRQDHNSEENPRGQMIWKGLRNGSFTYSGLALDVAKSAVQKYIRRGIMDKALMSAFELWRMVEVGGKAAQTNMYNRLAIICAEDVGPAGLITITWVLTHLQTKTKTGDRSPHYLATIVELLVQSPKTRVMSHLWRAYVTEDGRKIAIERGLKIDQDYTQEDVRRITTTDWSSYFKPQDPDDLVLLAKLFYLRLLDKDCNAVTWLGKYLVLSEGRKVATRNRRSKPMVIIWSLLQQFLNPVIYHTLYYWYFQASENRPYVMTAVTLSLFRTDSPLVDCNLDYSPQFELRAKQWRDCSGLQKLLTGQYRLEIDDYVVDKHTRQGRKMGLGRSEFVRDGALIKNEDCQFRLEVLEKIYIDS